MLSSDWWDGCCFPSIVGARLMQQGGMFFSRATSFAGVGVKGYRPRTNKVVNVQYGHQIDRPTRSVGLGTLL